MSTRPNPLAALVAIVLLAGCGPAEVAQQAAESRAAPEAEPTDSGADWTELVPNARRPMEGVVSGGQPTADQLARAADAGFKTVVNLRTPGERGPDDEPVLVAGLGMEYVALPIAGADDITEEKARELARVLDEAERPLLLHCGSGNRVGALLALSAYHLEGRSSEEALQYGLDSGLTRLEPVVRERLQQAPPSRH